MEAEKILKLSIFFALFISLAPVSIKAAAPDPITDLRCAFSGTPGNVWLSWSVPAGNPTSYDIRYSLYGINAGDYDTAFQYGETWAGNSGQGMIVGLTQQKTWFFAMKAVNGDGTSAISNVVGCQPNSAAASTALVTVPSSSISNLQDGAEIPSGKDFLIKGSSSDYGGSSVQKVEISFDNGVNWRNAVPVKQAGTGFEWQYNWTAPAAGEYLVKTRATDWIGARESVATSTGMKIKAMAAQSGTAVSASTTQASSTVQAGDSQDRRNLLIQIIQLLIQLLSKK